LKVQQHPDKILSNYANFTITRAGNKQYMPLSNHKKHISKIRIGEIITAIAISIATAIWIVTSVSVPTSSPQAFTIKLGPGATLLAELPSCTSPSDGYNTTLRLNWNSHFKNVAATDFIDGLWTAPFAAGQYYTSDTAYALYKGGFCSGNKYKPGILNDIHYFCSLTPESGAVAQATYNCGYDLYFDTSCSGFSQVSTVTILLTPTADSKLGTAPVVQFDFPCSADHGGLSPRVYVPTALLVGSYNVTTANGENCTVTPEDDPTILTVTRNKGYIVTRSLYCLAPPPQ
jgi:hypothetical protein